MSDRFIWTHPTTAPRTPVAPAHVPAHGPATAAGAYPAGVVYPPVPAPLAAYSATVRGRTPHGLHLVLSLVTFGLWVPVWMAHAVWNHATRKRITVPVR
jgi:hypothetical protein